jgi:predicted ester cyclase
MEDNKALMRRFFDELYNRDNLAIWQELVSPDQPVHRTFDAPGPLEMRRAFPDGQVTVDDQVAEGDKVVTRLTFRGTHQGEFATPFGTFAPSGKQLTFTWISINRIHGGKIAESWVEGDALGLLRQLGAIKSI